MRCAGDTARERCRVCELQRAGNSIVAQLRGKCGGCTRQAFGSDTLFLAREVEVVHHVGRNAVQMTVVDLKAGDHESHTFGAECFSLRDADLASHIEHVGVECGRQVDPVVIGFAWHDECVTGANWGDGHEHDTMVVAQRKVTGQFAVDDAREERSHGATIADMLTTSAN